MAGLTGGESTKMKRYYDLDKDGKVSGSFANPQENMNLVLLEECPFQYGIWDGKKWKEDTSILDPKQVLLDELNSATTIAGLKNVIKKMLGA